MDDNEKNKLLKVRYLMAPMSWWCDDDHVSVSELTISYQEAKSLEPVQYDLSKPMPSLVGMLWFSVPTSLNRRI